MDDVTLHERFIKNVNRLLDEKEMSRSDLARAMGVDRMYITGYLGSREKEDPRSRPGLDVIARFADGLGEDPVELMKEPQPENELLTA